MNDSMEKPTPYSNVSKAQLVQIALTSPSVVIDVLAHRSMGPRYFDARIGGAVVMMLAFAGLLAQHDPRPLLWFTLIFLIMNVVRRLETFWANRRDRGVHSKYGGRPLLCRYLPRLSERAVKHYVEPVLFAGLGLLSACSWNAPLGLFLIYAAFMAWAQVETVRLQLKQRRMDLSDTMLDQQMLHESRW